MMRTRWQERKTLFHARKADLIELSLSDSPINWFDAKRRLNLAHSIVAGNVFLIELRLIRKRFLLSFREALIKSSLACRAQTCLLRLPLWAGNN